MPNSCILKSKSKMRTQSQIVIGWYKHNNTSMTENYFQYPHCTSCEISPCWRNPTSPKEGLTCGISQIITRNSLKHDLRWGHFGTSLACLLSTQHATRKANADCSLCFNIDQSLKSRLTNGSECTAITQILCFLIYILLLLTIRIIRSEVNHALQNNN